MLNEKGKPIPDAVVALWMSDAVGNYDMVGYKYHGFQRTDAQGRYEFTCIIPGCYEPRGASHLHVKVQGDSQPITTQLYIEGVPGNEDDHYYSSELLVQHDRRRQRHQARQLRLRHQAGHGAGERHAGEPGREGLEPERNYVACRGAPSLRGSVSHGLDCQSSIASASGSHGGSSKSRRRPSS